MSAHFIRSIEFIHQLIFNNRLSRPIPSCINVSYRHCVSSNNMVWCNSFLFYSISLHNLTLASDISSFHVPNKDQQMADRVCCVSLYPILIQNVETYTCPHCNAMMVQYVDMQQVDTQPFRFHCHKIASTER